MKFKVLIWITAIAFLAGLAVPVGLTAQEQKSESPQQYVVTDLGTLGGTFSVGLGISKKRLVNGNSTLPGDTQVHAFLWRNGTITDLGTLGGPNSNSNSPLNDRGEVAGFSNTATPDPLGEGFCPFGTSLICLPFFWRDGVMTPLPTLGGNNGQAFEINNRGQAAGIAENSTKDPTCVAPQVLQFKPVIFERGEIQELPTLAGDADGFAVAINERGLVVGSSGNCATPDAHAVLWQPHDEGEAQNEGERFIVTNLGSLGGTASNDPQDINNAGQVVGSSSLSDGTIHAFLWTPDKGMQDLGTLPGDVMSFGNGINRRGQVVGSSLDANGNTRAFVRQNGVLTDLNTLIPAGSSLFLFDAFGINDRGDIVGDALDMNTGETHAYLASSCDAEDANNAGCKASPGGANLSQRPKVVLPESARRLLRRRLGPH
jgi:probable HAF family extracellular repeat protein